jgi:hypothetical protein
MEFRDPRILAPGHKQLDKPIKAAADLIVRVVNRFASDHDVQPAERGFWASLGEMRALDLIDAAFAEHRDQLEGVAGRTIAEREYDVAIGRAARDLEQAMRTRVAMAEDRGENPREALDAAVDMLRLHVAHLGRWIGEEILPELPGEAGV